MISIAALIYRSPAYADSVWESLHRHTPHLHDGRARFFFVANDPEDRLLRHLDAKQYPYLLQRNKPRDEHWLACHGLAGPAYLHRVYCGWNRAIRESEEWCVLVNSDMRFSPGWLEALWDCRGKMNYVVSQLFEPDRQGLSISTHIVRCDLGTSPRDFNESGWLRVCAASKATPGVQWRRARARGAFQPCLIFRDSAMRLQGFPQGNVLRPGRYYTGQPYGRQSGDHAFVERLKAAGGQHFTARHSLVYHFHEGEDREP